MLTILNHSWPCMIMVDHVWLYVTICDYVWLWLTMFDFGWPCLTMLTLINIVCSWLTLVNQDWLWSAMVDKMMMSHFNIKRLIIWLCCFATSILVDLCQIATFLNGYVTLKCLSRVMLHFDVPKGLYLIITSLNGYVSWQCSSWLDLLNCYVP